VHDLRVLSRLVRSLRALRPDVIVYATPKAGLLGGIAAWLLRIPVRVYQLWGLRFESVAGAQRYTLKMLERLTARASTHVVANSRSLADEASKHRIAPNIDVLGPGSSHGVDVDRFSPEAEGIPDLDPATKAFLAAHTDGSIVIFVGRVHRDKGIDTLISALDLLRDSERSMRAIIIGRLESGELEAYLETAQQRLALHIVGWVDDTRPYLLAADVLCLPTLREGFPNVVLEAAAMRTPAVVSNATGAIDSVIDGVTGRVFPVGDARELARTIWEVTTGGDLADMGARARVRVESEFSSLHVWELQNHYLKGRLSEQVKS
jgi:glycosyltransferase involved in cell wall biosynthesis